MGLKSESVYRVEQFTLEEKHYKEIADLITTAFVNDPDAIKSGASIVFSEHTLRMIFGAPSVDKTLFVRTVFTPTEEIVGFMGLIPKKLSIKGQVYNFAIPAWAAVHVKHQRKGVGKMMGKKMFHIAKEQGYEGGFALFEPEQRGKDASMAVAQEEDIPFQRIFETKRFIIRVFDPDEIAKVVKINIIEKLYFGLKKKILPLNAKNIRLFEEKDIDRMFELVQEHVERNTIAIVPNYEDFKWLLSQEKVKCVVHTDDKNQVQGYMLAWEFNLAGFGNSIPFGWLDLIHIHNLTLKQAKNLANYLSYVSKETGWIGLQTPYIPYFDSKPLRKANFIFFPKTLTLDLFNLNNIPLPQKQEIKGLYFDWR